MNEDEWDGFDHPDQDQSDDLDREVWVDEDRQLREAATNRRLFSCKNNNLRRSYLRRVLFNDFKYLAGPRRRTPFCQ